MTCVAVTGASGYVGRFIVNNLLAGGHQVIVLGRKAPNLEDFAESVEFRQFSLDDSSISHALFNEVHALVHVAFHHEAGKYRGGEGDDPDGFIKRNLNGTNTLFETAKTAGVKRAIFLSSRAIYGQQEPGATLFEDTPPKPDTLYGKTKLQAEDALATLADDTFLPVSLRATGVYGSPSCFYKHKWSDLFEQFRNGKKIAPRIGTEVHGEDLAAAIDLLLHVDKDQMRIICDNKSPVFNVSDILLDRHMLLKTYAAMIGETALPLPEKTDANTYNQMDCTRLRKFGWQPRGKLDLTGLTHNEN